MFTAVLLTSVAGGDPSFVVENKCEVVVVVTNKMACVCGPDCGCPADKCPGGCPVAVPVPPPAPTSPCGPNGCPIQRSFSVSPVAYTVAGDNPLATVATVSDVSAVYSAAPVGAVSAARAGLPFMAKGPVRGFLAGIAEGIAERAHARRAARGSGGCN